MFIVLTSPNDGSQFWAWRHFATAAPDDRSTASDERRCARGPNPDRRGHVAETAAAPGRRRPFSRDGPAEAVPGVVSLLAPGSGPEILPEEKADTPDRRREKSGQGSGPERLQGVDVPLQPSQVRTLRQSEPQSVVQTPDGFP